MTESKNLVVKHNFLVEAEYKFDIWETRLFAKLITMIGKDDKEFKTYEINIKSLMDFFGKKSNNDYKRIKKAADKLMDKKIRAYFIKEVKDENGAVIERLKRKKKIHLIASIEEPDTEKFEKNNSMLCLTFHPDLKPYLLDLQDKIVKYNIENLLSLPSTYSIRFFELLVQYKKIGYIEFEVSALQERLGSNYKRYNDLKTRVIQPARANTKKSAELTFDFKEFKRQGGRKITHIGIRILPNKPKRKYKTTQTKTITPKGSTQPTTEDPETTDQTNIDFTPVAPTLNDEIYENQAVQELIKRKVTHPVAVELSQDYDDDIILYTIKRADAVHEQHPRSNLAGFIVDSLKKRTYQIELQEQQQKQEKKRKEAEIKAIRVENDRQIRELYKQFATIKKQRFAEIMETLDEKEQSEIFALTREKFGLALKSASNEQILKNHLSTLSIKGSDYLTENGQMTTKESDFYEWIEATHKVKVRKNGDFYEVVS